MSFLPYARQTLDAADIEAVVKVLQSDFLTTGPALEGFEAALAQATGAVHALACSSGTAALHLALAALELGPGDAAIVPSITFLATANAARYCGAEPVFADVDPTTGLMTPSTLEEALGRTRAAGLRPRAVLPVHLTGQCAPVEALAAVAAGTGAVLVEDACHAIGTAHRGPGDERIPVGACRWSAMATFSFHAVKTIAAGEGGAVTTNDPALARRVALLRNHGMTREAASFRDSGLSLDDAGEANPWSYEMAEPGWNYRLTDIQAALAASQLRRLAAITAQRAGLAAQYDALLAGGPARPIPRVEACSPAWHLYSVLIDFAGLGLTRAGVMKALRAAGIGTQVHYIPVHRQPYYAACNPGLSLPGADAYYAATLSLPLYESMRASDTGRVVSCLRTILSDPVARSDTGFRQHESRSRAR